MPSSCSPVCSSLSMWYSSKISLTSSHYVGQVRRSERTKTAATVQTWADLGLDSFWDCLIEALKLHSSRTSGIAPCCHDACCFARSSSFAAPARPFKASLATNGRPCFRLHVCASAKAVVTRISEEPSNLCHVGHESPEGSSGSSLGAMLVDVELHLFLAYSSWRL